MIRKKQDLVKMPRRGPVGGNVPVIWEEEQMRAFLMEQVPK